MKAPSQKAIDGVKSDCAVTKGQARSTIQDEAISASVVCFLSKTFWSNLKTLAFEHMYFRSFKLESVV